MVFVYTYYMSEEKEKKFSEFLTVQELTDAISHCVVDVEIWGDEMNDEVAKLIILKK